MKGQLLFKDLIKRNFDRGRILCIVSTMENSKLNEQNQSKVLPVLLVSYCINILFKICIMTDACLFFV